MNPFLRQEDHYGDDPIDQWRIDISIAAHLTQWDFTLLEATVAQLIRSRSVNF